MNNENLLIENDVIELSHEVCKFITDPVVRNRAVANVVAAKTVLNYFSDLDVNVDVKSGLHNISQILEFWEISDIYINGAYVDVRLYFDESELCVPKYHFDNNLLPVAYMFVKIDKNLSGALVTGFIKPENIDNTVEYNGYYKLDESDLVSYYDVSDLFFMEEIELPDDIDMMLFEYFDCKNEEKSKISSYLLCSEYARLKLIDISNTNNLFNYVSIDTVLNGDKDEEDTLIEVGNQESLETEILDSSNDLLLDNSENFMELENNDEIEVFDTDLEDISEEDFDSTPFEELNVDFIDQNNNEFTTEVTPSISSIEGTDGQEEDLLSENSDDLDLVEPTNEALTDSIECLYPNDVDNNINEASILDAEASENTIESEVNASGNSGINSTVSTLEFVSDDIEQEAQVVNNNTIVEEELLLELDSDEANSYSHIEEKYEEQDSEMQETAETDIDNLFNAENDIEQAEVVSINTTKKGSKVLPIIGVLVLLGAIGYFGFAKNINAKQDASSTKKLPVVKSKAIKAVQEKIAMPVETVENVNTDKAEEIGTSISVPEIEGNLDASILVSNLVVNWEVPVSYVSNVTSKRYFTKIGKIIQMNLKTEMLLLNKPPITNKIVLNLDYNKSTQKFRVKEVVVSSGEEQIDNMIKNTVNNVLNNNYNFNMNVFNELQGVPNLVIRL